MFWYFFIIFIIFCDFCLEYLFNRISSNKASKVNNIFSFIFKYRFITIITLVVFSTFKSLSVGYDTGAYFNYYNVLSNREIELFKNHLANRFEFGYTYLNSFLAQINAPYRTLLFIISLFVSIVLVLFVNKVSPNKFMSIVLYIALGVFAQSLSANRQIIAMAFVLLAIMFLIDKKWIKACFMILFGSFFHVSALICLILVPLRYIRIKWWMVAILFVCAGVISFALPQILKLMEKFTVVDFYSKYYVASKIYINPSNLINTLYSIGLIAIFVIMFIGKSKILKFSDNNKAIYDYFVDIFMFVAMFRIIGYFANMPELFNRLNMYFFLSLLILIPMFVEGLKQNRKVYIIANISVYIIAILFMWYLYSVKLSCGVVPYVFGIM